MRSVLFQFAIKKNNERAILAAKNNDPNPPRPLHVIYIRFLDSCRPSPILIISIYQVPLPTWKAIKDRVLKQIADSKLAQAERTAHWEKKQQVRNCCIA